MRIRDTWLLAVCLLFVVGCPAPENGGDKPDVGADIQDDGADVLESPPSFHADCSHYGNELMKCSTTVSARGDKPAVGLTLDDFTVTEDRVDDGEVVDTKLVEFDASPTYQFGGAGFWEESLTSAKVDIVIAVDNSGTMREEIPQIRTAIERLVERLQGDHVDFRMRFIEMFSFYPRIESYPFRSSMEVDRLMEDIEPAMSTEGEDWRPMAAYETLLLSTGNAADRTEFRADARKVVVFVTDTIPANVYSQEWLNTWSHATRSAAGIALADFEQRHGDPLHVLYAQPDTAGDPAEDPSADYNCEDGLNPMACDTGFDEFGTALGWPLTAEAIYAAIDEIFPEPLADMAVEQSRYHFAWQSKLDFQHIEETDSIDASIEVRLPDEDPLSETASMSPILPRLDPTVGATGETGEVPENLQVTFYRTLGSRVFTQSSWSMGIKEDDGGVGTFGGTGIPCGEYLMLVTTTGAPDQSYNRVRRGAFRAVEWCGEDGERVDIEVPFADRDTDLWLLRGLAKDLSTWGPIDQPFDTFAHDLDAWARQLQDGNMTWQQYNAVQRLVPGLSGYVNTIGYADVVVDGAVDDFTDASLEVRKLVERMNQSESATKSALEDPTTAALLSGYIAERNQDAINKHTQEEIAIEAITAYLKGPLLEEALTAMGEIISANVEDGGVAALVMDFASAIVTGEWDNLDDLILQLAEIGLKVAVDEAIEQASSAVADQVGDAIDDLPSDRVTESVETLVEAAVQGLLEAGVDALRSDSASSLRDTLESHLEDAVQELGSKEEVLEDVDYVFAEVHARLAYGTFRNFVWPMFHALLRGVIIEEQVNGKMAFEIISRQFVNRMLLYPYYADPLHDGMTELFNRARSWEPEGTFWDQRDPLTEDIRDCRGEIYAYNDRAQSDLGVQDSIDDWEEWMETGQTIVAGLEIATVAACNYYPKFCGPAYDEIPTLMNLLSGLRIMTNIFEIALKIDFLNQVSGRVDDCNVLLFPSP